MYNYSKNWKRYGHNFLIFGGKCMEYIKNIGIKKVTDWLSANRAEILGAIVAALAGLFLAATVYAASGENAHGEQVPHNIIRLHILAADDTAQEQELKLTVRDDVWGFVEDMLEGVDDKTAAKEIINRNLFRIEEKARGILRDNGASHDVRVRLVNDLLFPPMLYGGMFFLPKGEYDALQIIIGEGAGENWWCVMFPPLCLMDITQGAVRLVDDSGDVTLRPRFKVLELFKR